MRRLCWLPTLFFVGCATVAEFHPSSSSPRSACHISCSNHGEQRAPSFVMQHRCSEGSMSRQFEPVMITGETIAIDEATGKKIAKWITREGDYAKTDVVLQQCDSYVRGLQSAMSAEQRGTFPGEDSLGHSLTPP